MGEVLRLMEIQKNFAFYCSLITFNYTLNVKHSSQVENQ